MSEVEKVNELLLGKYFHHYENLGTSWAFEFDNDIWLSAQEVEFPDEKGINDALVQSQPYLYAHPNSEDMAKSLMVLRVRGYAISAIEFLVNSELKLIFEHGFTMYIKTNTDIVDWHWSLSKTNTCPYTESIIACYDASEFK